MKLPVYQFRKADERALIALYESLPTIDCKGQCYEACGPIAASPIEHERIRRRGGQLECTVIGRCSKLNEDNRCSVYEARPLVCRLFGVVERMRCPFGCKPSRMLTDKEGEALILATIRIAGQPYGAPAQIPPELAEKFKDDPEMLKFAQRTAQHSLDQRISTAMRAAKERMMIETVIANQVNNGTDQTDVAGTTDGANESASDPGGN